VASRTQIVCLHEGERGRSIDPIFIRILLKALDPAWLRPWKGNNIVRAVDGGGRSALIERMPAELRSCLAMGGDTTLMVWADLDHDTANGEELKAKFWTVAQQAGITKDQFDQVVFVFAKDRIENWIEFLLTGATDESRKDPGKSMIGQWRTPLGCWRKDARRARRSQNFLRRLLGPAKIGAPWWRG